MPIENQKYKDTVFRMLFNNKKNLLELYNAINGTNYDNPEDLVISTLRGNTYLNMKNDVSFLLDFELNLYEHQSTLCPNIPLRDLYYIASSFMELIPLNKTYRESLIKIPTPRFFVFYNGSSHMDDKTIFKLSDMFSHQVDTPSLDLSVTAFNVNEGHNKELMNASQTLKGYSIFVSKVRKYKQLFEVEYNISNNSQISLLSDKEEVTKEIISKAVNRTIDECIAENILKDFFITYREEVVAMSLLEYTAEGHIKELQDESYENGIKSITDLYAWLYSNNRDEDAKKASYDPSYLQALIKEFNNIDK